MQLYTWDSKVRKQDRLNTVRCLLLYIARNSIELHNNLILATEKLLTHWSTHWSNFLHHHTFENSLIEPVSFLVKPDQDVNASISVCSSAVVSFPVVVVYEVFY